MKLEPRKSFKGIIKVLDIINPFLIILSIIGLYLEYSSLKVYVLQPNKIISVMFVVDFALRLLAFNPSQYFTKAYGWVDFLASLPGIFFFLDNTPLFSIFKVIRVGRFFKIIRILRFLRVFNFLKRMKSDSIWIQDRIMKTGVTIVLIFVVGIVTIDSRVFNSLKDREVDSIESIYSAVSGDLDSLLEEKESILYLIEDNIIYDRNREIINDFETINKLLIDEIETYITVSFSSDNFLFLNSIELPKEGVIIPFGALVSYQNQIMLTLLTTLLGILTAIIFYMGFVFARDIQIVQLIIDSYEAGDDLLLKQEAERYRDEDGELKVNYDDSELINLLKVCASKEVDSSNDVMLMNLAGMMDNNIEEESNSSEDLEFIAEKTIKKLTPAIVKYIKKELKH